MKITRFIIRDLVHPMEDPRPFDNLDIAKAVLEEEYTNRNKGDGHDEYWRNRNTGIVKVTIEEEIVFSNKK